MVAAAALQLVCVPIIRLLLARGWSVGVGGVVGGGGGGRNDIVCG